MLRQEALIAFLLEELKSYKGVKAMYLKGSLASGTDDEYSDVDFYCLVEEEYYESLLQKRQEILSMFRPIVYTS